MQAEIELEKFARLKEQKKGLRELLDDAAAAGRATVLHGGCNKEILYFKSYIYILMECIHRERESEKKNELYCSKIELDD
jgi:hypothetical protein